MDPVIAAVLRCLRWAWLLPLLPTALLDISNAGSGSGGSGLVLAITALALIASSLATVLTLGLGGLGGGSSSRTARSLAMLAAILLLVLAAFNAFDPEQAYLSSALMYAALVLVGVGCAHAGDVPDLALAAVVAVAGVLVPAPLPLDGIILASLMSTAMVISAALGLVVREQRRGVAAARRRAVAAERRSMAHELHDTVAHELTGILVLAQAANHGPSSAPIALIEKSAQRAMEQLRELVLTSRDEPDLEEGRAARAPSATGRDAFLHLAHTFAEHSSARVDIDVAHVSLSTPGWLALQRMCSEALTNVRRHGADASHVKVLVHPVGSGVEMVVANDGRSGEGIGGGAGTGLLGAHERAMLLGGDFSAGRDDAGWWQVKVYLPSNATVRTPKETR